MGIFVSSDAKIDEGIKEIKEIINYPVIDNLEWTSFASGTMGVFDNPNEVKEALQEFIYILANSKMEKEGITVTMHDSYSFFEQLTNNYENSDKTKLPELTELIEIFTIDEVEIFEASVFFSIYYLSRQLLQSCGFCSKGPQNTEKQQYTVDFRKCSDGLKYVFDELIPDIYNLKANIGKRLRNEITVDNINLPQSSHHVLYRFLATLTESNVNTKKLYIPEARQDSQKLFLTEFALLFNPFVNNHSRFESKTLSVRLTEKLKRQNAYKDSPDLIEQGVNHLLKELESIKQDILNLYISMFRRIFFKQSNKKISFYLFTIGSYASIHSFMGINRFGSFWCDCMNIKDTPIIPMNLPSDQFLYIKILGYDNSTKSNYYLTIQDTCCIEFEGNIHTNGGLRPILRTSSYYTNMKSYYDDLSENFIGENGIGRFYESIRSDEQIIDFYKNNTKSKFATFDRSKGCLQLYTKKRNIFFSHQTKQNSPIVLMYKM